MQAAPVRCPALSAIASQMNSGLLSLPSTADPPRPGGEGPEPVNEPQRPPQEHPWQTSRCGGAAAAPGSRWIFLARRATSPRVSWRFAYALPFPHRPIRIRAVSFEGAPCGLAQPDQTEHPSARLPAES